MTRPQYLHDRNAAAFEDSEVANNYRHRLPCPAETFTFLAGLIVDKPLTRPVQ
jgi:hypothetical protein